MDDIHGNLYAPCWYPLAFRQAMARDYLRRGDKPINDQTIEKTLSYLDRMLTDDDGRRALAVMDAAGIRKRIIVILDFGLELGEAEKSIEDINADILDICARSDGRLIGFCGVDPRRSNACELAEHAFRSQGAQGLKLHPTASWTLLGPECLQLVNVASNHGAPVLAHIGKTVDVLDSHNAKPEDFINLARRFPASQFIAGHCGFDLWETFVLLRDTVPENLYFDISGWQEMYGGDWSALRTPLARLGEAFPGRVGFGTDAPFYGYNLPMIEKRWRSFIQDNFLGKLVEWDRVSSRLI